MNFFNEMEHIVPQKGTIKPLLQGTLRTIRHDGAPVKGT